MKNFLIATLLLTLFSCDYSHTSGGTDLSLPQGQGGLSDPSNPTDGEPTVRFADVDRIVFMPSCSGCHQKKGLDLSFADYANSKSFASDIFTSVFITGEMPPRGQLTDLQAQVLRTWLDNGAPE